MKDMVQGRDLRTLAEVGKALWMDPREREVATLETLSAVMLLNLTPDRVVERAAKGMLERVTRRGRAANFRSNLDAGLKPGQTFFNLTPEDRFLLIALHLGRWSYGRLARVWKCSAEEIETQAWTARLRFAASEKTATYPAGASSGGAHCPEYDSSRPWTQRFLDEEITSGRERLYLQNHLMACDSCRDALRRCRESYYQIERVLPRIASEVEEDAQLLKAVETVSRRSLGILYPADRTFIETWEIFSRRWDIRVALILLGGVLVSWMLKIF
jgi:hypothetical protein